MIQTNQIRKSFHNMGLALSSAAAAATLFFSVGCDGSITVSRTQSLTATYVPGEGLDVTTENGAVEIIVDPACTDILVDAKVKTSGHTMAEAEARQSEVILAIEHRDSTTMAVTAHFPKPRHGNEGCSFSITTPASAFAIVRTSNGSIKLTGIEGRADVDTSNGSITVNGLGGPAVLRTSNGSIDVTSAQAGVDADTSNGTVRVIDSAGKMTIRTSNGSVTVHRAAGDDHPVLIDTSNGNVEITISASMTGEIVASTSNGRVNVDGATDAASISGDKTSKRIVLHGASGAVGESGTSASTSGSGSESASDAANRSVIDTSNGTITITIER